MKLLIPILLLFSVVCFSQTETTLTSFSKTNYKLEYPKSWRLDTSRVMGTEFFLFSPLEDETDKFRENVNVIIQNLVGQNINLEKYKQITENQLNTVVTDCKVYESTILTSNSKEFYKVVYAMTQGQFRLKLTSLCYIKNEKAYLTTFSSEISKYEQYKNVAEKIMNSFSISE